MNKFNLYTYIKGYDMVYYVYKITEKNGGRFYIGARSSNIAASLDLGVRYFSSSNMVKKIINTISVDAFIFEIVNDTYECWKDAYDAEQLLIFENWNNPLILNKACYYGKKDFGVISDDAKQTLSKKTLERWKDPLFRDAIGVAQRKSWSAERKLKQSNRLKNEFWTSEMKQSHSEKMMGRVGSTKLKGVKKPIGFGEIISNKLKNVPKTIIHKKRLSEARLGKKYPHIRKLSPEIILEIYDKLSKGESYIDIKANYNITTSMVYRIKNRSIIP